MYREINRQAFDIPDESRFYYEHGDRKVFILASLNMGNIEWTLNQVRIRSNPVLIICLEWQEPLFRELLTPICGRDMRVLMTSKSFEGEIAAKLDNYWR